MKKLIYVIEFIVVILMCIIFYRLGYCDACDKYIDASECKPTRQLHFFDV